MRPLRVLLLVITLLSVACGRAAEPGGTEATVAPGSESAVSSPVAPTTEAGPAEDYPLPGAEASAEAIYPGPEESPAGSGSEPSVAYPGAAEDDPGLPVWSADGVIGAGEYRHRLEIGQVVLHWSNDSEYLYLAAEAETSGWLGIGIDPEDRMQGADYVIAAAPGGTLQLFDAYGQAPVGATHPEDTALGGSTDLMETAVAEQDGWVRLEVQRPLASGDAYDRPLSPGTTYTVIVGIGANMEYDARHTYRGQGEITLD
ncbi:MAG: hypothetical protein GXX94_00975 [Chloroflexi bacterium]|nr:hypothetical protein [Chloroflexota bacterium]